jgi:hydroxyacylglutathione hydrolase
MASQIVLVPCREDNYGYLIHDPATGATASIDAPEAGPLQTELARQGWTLTDILVTHHHHDHVGGIAALKTATGCRVVAADADRARIADVDLYVEEGEQVAVGSLTARVIDTPGHTVGHIAYWFSDEEALFCGDTLFSLGCGRLFEGTPADMWRSLLKLRALPGGTRVFCGHEYTQSNARFALSVDGGNPALVERANEVDILRGLKRPTIPATIAMEKAANPFLRADQPGMAPAVGLPVGADPVAVLKELRERKNRFS